MHWERACVNECVLPNNQADSPLPGRLLLDQKAVAATKVAYPEEGNASFGKPAPVALKISAQNRRNKPPHPTSPAGSGPTSLLSGGDPEPVFRRVEKQVFITLTNCPESITSEGRAATIRSWDGAHPENR